MSLSTTLIDDTILLCGRQDVSLRGQRDDCPTESLSNRGNFMAILEMAAKSDDVLRSHLEPAAHFVIMVVPMKEEHNSQ